MSLRSDAGARKLIGALLTLAAAPTSLPAAEPVNPPHIDYMLHCQGCHAADGSGFPGAVPKMKDEVGKFLRVPGGREFLVQVPGVAQSMLDDAALARVLNWMVREFDPAHTPSDTAPYTPEEVGRLRARKLVEVTPLRTQLLDTFNVATQAPRDRR